MVEIADIRDVERFADWLSTWLAKQGIEEERAVAVAVAIAHRMAMRVLPLWWEWSFNEVGRERDLTALPVLWCNIVSAVGAKMSSPGIMANAVAAGHVAFADASLSTIATDAADVAATADSAYSAKVVLLTTRIAVAVIAGDAAGVTNAAETRYLIVKTAEYAAKLDDYSSALWNAVRADCEAITKGLDVFLTPLWPTRENPLGNEWRDIKSWATGPEWAFWIKWYDDALAGRAPNWDMLERIALIDPEVWDAGPEAVAEKIAGIEIEYAIAATPNAEDIRINEAGLYEAIPRSALPARTLQDAKDRIVDTIRLIRNAQTNNQYTALTPEADLLEDVPTRHGDNPLRLFEVCTKVTRHIGAHVANGVLPENDNLIGDVTGDLMNTADDIYNFDEEARKTVDARAKLRFGRLDEAQKQKVVELADAVAEHSVEPLAQELREDAGVVAQEGELTQEKATNRYRLGSRLVRVIALGGGALVVVTTALSQAPGAVAGAQYLWQIIRPLIGF